jgi:recombination protein RecR
MKLPQSLENVIHLLQKIPGVGRRTAERYAFDLALTWTNSDHEQLKSALTALKQSLSTCPECGALIEKHICQFCSDLTRSKSHLVIVASAKEIFSLEKTNEYRGLYHVLGATLSPLDGRGEERLHVNLLQQRIRNLGVKEVILALDSTLEGDATALFLKEKLGSEPVKISRLAFGIPVGSSLDYVDGGTLARSFAGRLPF